VLVIVCVAARKLESHECPFNIYTDGYSSSSHNGSGSSATCLVLKKWVFTRSCEESLFADPRALHYIFNQVTDVATLLPGLFPSFFFYRQAMPSLLVPKHLGIVSHYLQ